MYKPVKVCPSFDKLVSIIQNSQNVAKQNLNTDNDRNTYDFRKAKQKNQKIAIQQSSDFKDNTPPKKETTHFKNDKQFQDFIEMIILEINMQLEKLFSTTNSQLELQHENFLLRRCDEKIQLISREVDQNQLVKNSQGQNSSPQLVQYPPEIKNIIVYVFKFWKSAICSITGHVKKLNSNFQTILNKHKKQFSSEKQQYQRKKQIQITAERNTIKTTKDQLEKGKQKENKLQQIIKNLQHQFKQVNTRNNKLKESFQSQISKRSQAQQLLKSSTKKISTFAIILNHNIQEQLTNVTNLLSEQSLNIILKQQGEVCSDYSVLVKTEHSQNSVLQFSILNGLDDVNQNFNLQQNCNQNNQLSDYQSELSKINENIFKMFERIKNQIRIQNQQREKRLKKYIEQNKQNKSFSKFIFSNSDSKNIKDNQSQMEISHLRIQFSIANEEKQVTMKKLAEKQYEISQANERIEELQKQLFQNNESIKIFQLTKQRQQKKTSIKYQQYLKKIGAEQQKNNNIEPQMILEANTHKMNDMRNTIGNLQQQIEELRQANLRFQLNKEEDQQYLRQKTQQYFDLKFEFQKSTSSVNLLNQRLLNIEAKMNVILAQKEIILLANNKLHRQIEKLREKINKPKLARAIIDNQEKKQIIQNLQKINNSIILQKVTKVDQQQIENIKQLSEKLISFSLDNEEQIQRAKNQQEKQNEKEQERNLSLILQNVRNADLSIEEIK